VKVNNGFRIAVAALLLLASQAVAALGLGQIRLKSGLGEPLLAEIPVVSSVPGELERLRVGLASPETFARIGLQPPQGIVAELRFNLALSDEGQPVIRVTTVEPIHEPMLSFLVEADWGQGRLVREYSALVDAPRTVSAPLAPPVEAPVAAPSSTIVRAPRPDPAPTADAGEVGGDAVGAVASGEAAPSVAWPATPAPVAATPASVAAATPGQVRVQAGDTLSELARDLRLGVSLEQAMIALLRSNPGAFIDGNIHMVRAGALLRVPDAAMLSTVDAAQALAQVRDQTRAWRQATQAVAQPAATGDAAAVAAQPGGAATDTDGAGPETGTRGADGRLEIVPPGAGDAAGAGDRSGISDGGEGDTMRQQLQQANEALAAREAELEEIKSRLAELEQLQADQQQLISLKDNELAAVQAELAQSRDQASEPGDGGNAAGWWFGAGALLLLLVLGGWVLRRKNAATPRFRAPAPAGAPVAAPNESLAAAFPASASAAAAARASGAAPASPAWHAGGAGQLADLPDTTPRPETAPHSGATPGVAEQAASATHPAEHTSRAGGVEGAPLAAHSTEAALPSDGAVDDGTEFPSEAPGHERLELARAYLDLGDRDSARQLLTELVVSGDLGSRQEATRLLRELD